MKMKGYLRYENVVWYVDLIAWESGGKAVVDIVNPDGSMRPATKGDGSLMEVLELGQIIPDPRLVNNN